MKKVPNLQPRLPNNNGLKLAIVGEAPGQDEETMGLPFIGHSGQLLSAILAQNGLSREQVFLGSVCQVRPPNNEIDRFDFYGSEIQESLTTLRADLATFHPNCTLALGRTAFRALCPMAASIDEDGVQSWQISNFRGSVLDGTMSGLLPDGHAKVIPSYHPAYTLRVYSDLPYLRWDVARAKRHSAFSDLRRTERQLTIKPSHAEVCDLLRSILATRQPCAFDVEGYCNNIGITMCSIARSPYECLVIPFFDGGQHAWSLEQESEIWSLLAQWLSNSSCPKIVQNGAYETFILAWSHGVALAGIAEDTMFKHWELHPELEKSLAIQASIYTEEPYYKHERLADDVDTKRFYNAKDSAITFECSNVQDSQLRTQKGSLDHYRFNVALMPAMSYLMLRGCNFDHRRAAQHTITAEATCEQLMLRIESHLGRPFNAKSTNDKKWLLYEFFEYKPFIKQGSPDYSTKEEVLLRYYAKHRHPLLKVLIDAISARTRISDINKLTCDADSRIRSNYNLVGTNTGRLSSSSSSAMCHYFTKTGVLKWDFTGTNLQNVTKDLRDCFIPDSEEFDFWQCDLSGADGWTVAADLAALGHPTMLEDYLAGIKPAKVLLLLLEEHEAGRNPALLNALDRKELAARTKAIKFPDGRDALGRQGDWKYLCMKRVQHGCVTGDHEVLTMFGWKNISQLNKDEAILTYDQTISTARWDVPSKLTNYVYEGELHNFEGVAYSLQVTHDHRMPLTTNNIPKVLLAEELLTRKAGKLPVSSEDYFITNEQPTETFVRQLAAFQADGYVTRAGHVGFHLKRQRKIDRLVQLFGTPDTHCYAADTTQQYTYKLPELAKCKKTDWSMLRLNGANMRIYLEESLHWDGSVQHELNHKRQEITTVELLRAEVLNTMAHLCGLGSQLTPNARTSGFGSSMHSVSLNRRKFANVDTLQMWKRRSESETVYCVTVSTGFFFVRRRNKIMVTGNTNYGMEPDKLSATIFKDSEGTIDLSTKDASLYQYLYKLRYNPTARVQWITRQLAEKGYLEAACGIRRRFYGIRNPRSPEPEVVREALSFEPQANTTYATNRALYNLWFDPQNRTSRQSLFVEPLLQVHDALAGQSKRSHRDFAATKLRQWFSTKLTIHGLPITIPFEGGFGPNWRDTKAYEI